MSTQTRTGENSISDAGTGGLLVVVGAILTAVAAVLPWLSTKFEGGGSMSGLDMIGDAVLPIFSPVLTVGLAIVAALLALMATGSQNARTGETLCGVVIAAVALLFVFSPGTVFGGGTTGALADAFLDPGIGAFATVGGGVAISAGGLVGYYD